jgi:hypothetical protein
LLENNRQVNPQGVHKQFGCFFKRFLAGEYGRIHHPTGSHRLYGVLNGDAVTRFACVVAEGVSERIFSGSHSFISKIR